MSDKLVTIHNCLYLHEAEFVKSVLEAEGIETLIPDEYTVGVQPFLGGAMGGIRVQVRQQDQDKAMAALAAIVEQPVDEA